MKKILNSYSNKRNANQNYSKISCHSSQNGNYQEYKQKEMLGCQDVGEKVHSYIAGGTANWCKHYVKWYDIPQKAWDGTTIPFGSLTQLSHSSVYIQKA